MSTFKKTGNNELDIQIRNWLRWNPEESQDYKTIFQLCEERNVDELRRLLLNRNVFGTAGIRAKMGPGFSQLNDCVIVQTNQGLANYLLDISDNKKDSKKRGVVVGFDGRHNSKRWAELTATTFLKYGFKVYLYSKMTPTPWVPYAVKHFSTVAGIMITASHNPKDDNGYKCYWQTGAQIVSPHDHGIQKSILMHLDLEPTNGLEINLSHGELIDPLELITNHYEKNLKDNLLDRKLNKESDLKVVYTAMHGVGANYIDRMFVASGFNVPIHVQEQREPHPDFPTVKFPNPEEGKSALDLAIKTAEEKNISVIIANDPDADRLGIAEKDSATENWKIFTGNEIGTLLGWFLFYVEMKKRPNRDRSKLYFIASTVSSKMLRAIAIKEGLHFEETLTGFKWMANKAIELEKDGNTVLMAYEESIGYMCGTTVLDKDGITAAVRFAELLGHLKKNENGISLSAKLNQLYTKYGYHCNKSSYFFNFNPALNAEIFNKIRKNEYPKSILNGKYKISHIRDLTTGYDSSTPDNVATLPTSSSSQMITFTFENGFVATIRTSGTEPKVKYYGEYCGKPEETNKDEIEVKCEEMINAIIDEFLQPEENKLTYRS